MPNECLVADVLSELVGEPSAHDEQHERPVEEPRRQVPGPHRGCCRAVARRIHQLLGLRKILWQPPQLPISSFHASGKVSASVIFVSAALAASPSFTKRPSKLVLSSQILGRASVSPPVFESSGKSFGSTAAFSWITLSAAWTLARSNSASPLNMAPGSLVALPMAL